MDVFYFTFCCGNQHFQPTTHIIALLLKPECRKKFILYTVHIQGSDATITIIIWNSSFHFPFVSCELEAVSGICSIKSIKCLDRCVWESCNNSLLRHSLMSISSIEPQHSDFKELLTGPVMVRHHTIVNLYVTLKTAEGLQSCQDKTATVTINVSRQHITSYG